jgi:hypothetical protein
LSLVVIAALALGATACGSASSGPGATTAVPTSSGPALHELPTPDEARQIVGQLWNQRETTLSPFASGNVGSTDTGALAAYDSGFLQYVLCGCAEPKAGHALSKVVPLVPKSAPDDEFLAAVLTHNSTTRQPVWYIVGVRKDGKGIWRLGLLTYVSEGARPLQVPLDAGGYAPAVTSGGYARLLHTATVNTHAAQRGLHMKVRHTAYGAAVRSGLALHLQKDGIFGYVLPTGRPLVCYTVHEEDRYSLPGGLAQDDSRRNWGPLLAPGAYSSITIDSAQSVCDLGSRRLAQYDPQHVAVTGASLSAAAA